MASSLTGVDIIAGRYATALFELASDERAVDAIEADIEALRSMLDESSEFVRFLRSPVLSRSDQEKAITALADKAGLKIMTRNFLAVLARKRRLARLPGIVTAFRALVAESRGEVTAEVRTAQELTAAQNKALSDALTKALKSQVKMNVTVDPSLLAGLMVKIGSRMIDGSLRSKLNRLKISMKGVG